MQQKSTGLYSLSLSFRLLSFKSRVPARDTPTMDLVASMVGVSLAGTLDEPTFGFCLAMLRSLQDFLWLDSHVALLIHGEQRCLTGSDCTGHEGISQRIIDVSLDSTA